MNLFGKRKQAVLSTARPDDGVGGIALDETKQTAKEPRRAGKRLLGWFVQLHIVVQVVALLCVVALVLVPMLLVYSNPNAAGGIIDLVTTIMRFVSVIMW